MRREFSQRLFALALMAAAAPMSATVHAATVGQPAPAFEVKDATGKTVKLADFKGKHVVLEWTNPGCPFVVKHYGAQNMQALQKDAKAKDVVWLSVSSMAPGQTDYLPPAALTAKYTGWAAAPTAVLMDDSGSVGKAYGAKNFVKAALAESLAGKPVSTATAQPCGCSVKYAS